MKKILLAAAVLFSFSTLAVADPAGGHGRGDRQVRRPVYRDTHPHDRYGYRGRHNDRYPPDRYYWHNGRHYYRYYQPFHHWVICIDGARYRAYPTACMGNGGVLYFW